MLARAEELSSAGLSEDAARLSESAGDRLLSLGNSLGAAVAYQRALHHFPVEVAARSRKHHISERLSGALSELGMASGMNRERRIESLFRAAARYWSDQPAGGHRAVCFECGELKPAGWIRCSSCAAVPKLSEQVAFGLLASERACSSERLREIGRRLQQGDSPIPPDVQRLFATALYQCSAEREDAPGSLPPGTVVAVPSSEGRAAVLLEVSTSGEHVSEKPECVELIEQVCARLLTSPDSVTLEDIRLLDGRNVAEAGGSVSRRLGSRIDFPRWRRIEVPRGAVGVAVVGATISRPRDSRPHRVRACGNLAAAAVALHANSDGTEMVFDLAGQLAHQLVRAHVVDSEHAELAGERFALDPSLTVADALGVLSKALEHDVRLGVAACYVRHPFADDEPPKFPGEAALRA
ncbi:MAG TPA: hypothetical protein VFQ35_01200 [Polyangiaceae bacterium]|nr:hypothetical protein [Polyangiaceae bacterium]